MIKVNLLVSRRSDLTRAQFRDYYEGRHGPLTLEHQDGLSFSRYVRNHIMASSGIPLDFDCISEFWYADAEAVGRAQTYMHTPASNPLKIDELNFIDTSKIRYFATEEQPVAGGARTREANPSHKTVLLFARPAEIALAAYRETLLDGAASLPAARVVADLPLNPEPAAHFDSLVTVWHAADAPPVAALEALPGHRLTLAMQAFETGR